MHLLKWVTSHMINGLTCTFCFSCVFNSFINILSYFSVWPMQSLTRQWIMIDSHLLLYMKWGMNHNATQKEVLPPSIPKMEKNNNNNLIFLRAFLFSDGFLFWCIFCMVVKWRCLGSQRIALLCMAVEKPLAKL